MNFEPEKFFIGLMDFFSILLPGALLTYFVQDVGGPWLFGPRYANAGETESAIRFLISSYLLGHFIFLAGSWVDELLYDPFRKGTDRGQIEKLAAGEMLSPRWFRRLAIWFFKNDDETLRQALGIKDRYIDPVRAKSAINCFQWSKARLTMEQPSTMASVQRFEADSKFFRSLAVVLLILMIFGTTLQGRRAVVILAAVGIAPALWRFADQRRKSINQAYWYVLTLEASKAGPAKPAEGSVSSSLRAGGAVFRKSHGVREYLLVEATDSPNEWVLPKGHIEPNEKTETTAVREVREETGVWARVMDDLDSISYEIKGRDVKVQFYLMEALEEGKAKEPRKHKWVSFNAAAEMALHDETKVILERANANLIRTHRAS